MMTKVCASRMMKPTLATRPFEVSANFTFWILQFPGWTTFGVYKWIVAPHTRGKTLVAIVIGFGITAGLRFLYKRLLAKSIPFFKIVAIAFGCSVFAGLIWPIIVESLCGMFRTESLHAGVWLQAIKANLKFPLMSNRVFVFLVWSALYFGITSWRDLQKQKVRTLQATSPAQEAHLAIGKITPAQRLEKFDYTDYLFLTTDKRPRFLKINTVVFICAAGDYSEIFTADGKKTLMLRPLKEWETRLPEKYFIRISRSAIVNLEYVERVERGLNYSYQVYCRNLPAPFAISRRYAARLKSRGK